MPSFEEIKEKMQNLIEKINYHNNLYYNEDNPIITDYEYDKLLNQLLNFEKKYPQLKIKNSPTIKIGGVASSSFNKIRHKVFMGSLQNAYSFDDIIKFGEKLEEKIKNISYIVEPKVDGLSVSLEYENGKFIRGSTRGDGFEGEDVTENLKTIKTIPKTLNKTISFVEVRAEIYMPLKEFNKLVLYQKNSGENIFKNPRNAAAGSLRQKNPLITATRNLKAICFNIQQLEDFNLKTHIEAIDLLANLGFYTIPKSQIFSNIIDCKEKIEEIKNQKQYYDFEIDGAVIKVNSLKDREILGATSKNPRWAIAFKYPPEEEQTTLKNIEIKVGRTGVLTPVAVFDTVNLSGTSINKATLHNQDFIDKNDIRIGDLISIKKAGEIIPEVVKSIKHKKNSKTYKIPNKCPICDCKVVKVKSFIKCINPKCPATKLQNMIHFVSKDAMDISGLGEKTIQNLIDKKLITDISDIYLLDKDKLSKMENFKDKSISNLLQSIEKSKQNPAWRLLFGLGIKEVGQKTAKLICKKYSSILDIANAKMEELMNIKEIGEIIALNITKYFESQETKKLILKLQNLGLNLISNKLQNTQKLHNLSFVITGKFENFSRNELKNKIESNGGDVKSLVSLKTNYLITGKNPGSKLQKAKNLKIKILNETEFLNLIS